MNKWGIILADECAIREDGVQAKRTFTSQRPFAVIGPRGKQIEWLSGNRVSVRCFRSLGAAIKAADKAWPLRRKRKSP